LGGVVACGGGVVDGAGADDHEQARIAAGEYIADLVASLEDRGGGALGDREFLVEKDGRKHDLGPLYSEIICAVLRRHSLGRNRPGRPEYLKRMRGGS
jgi:hypothetical protein